ncbi:uncharacterized protein [Palaemon carinicauda]|uniref:uncharacterized protein n=1 Tax=Palaemon carinicauda TaxID=392227 RepID=UPI0035B5FFFD
MRPMKEKPLMGLLFLTSFVSFGITAALPNYCLFTPLHTMCLHKGLGRTCGNNVPYRGVGIRDVERIVDWHNHYRSKVALGMEATGSQPPASNMRLMEWDHELAQIAQSHADQCLFVHDCPDCRRVSRFSVGQNLCINAQRILNSTIDWIGTIDNWYNEVEFVNSDDLEPYSPSYATGRYTQMMWSNSYKVGCGFTMFLEGGWWKKLYTCDYGPSGNILSYQMYERGRPCSSCPRDTVCSEQYPGLCAPVWSSVHPHWVLDEQTEEELTNHNEEINATYQDRGYEERVVPLEELQNFEDSESQNQQWGIKAEGTSESSLPGGYETGSLRSLQDQFANVKGFFQVLLGLQPHHSSGDRSGSEEDDEAEEPIFLSTYSNEEPIRIQKREADVLFACDHHHLPCEFSVEGGDWIAGESDEEGRYNYTVIETGQKSVLRCNTKVSLPQSGDICVVISHVRHLESDSSTLDDDGLPELLLDLKPVEDDSSDATQNRLTGESGLWKISRVTIRNVTSPFFFTITIGPAKGRTVVALNAIQITDGVCSE